MLKLQLEAENGQNNGAAMTQQEYELAQQMMQ